MTDSKQTAENRLYAAVMSQHPLHAFFLSCNDAYRALTIANRAAALHCMGEANEALLKNCPDYILFGQTHTKIDDLRAVMADLAKRPFLDGGRAVVIQNAHALKEDVQNALLKTLEEPPSSTVFFLTGNPSGVLSTIRSRCALIHVPDPTAEEIRKHLLSLGASPRDASLYLRIGGGSMAMSIRMFEDESYREKRNEALNVFTALLNGSLPLSKTRSLHSGGFGADALAFMLSYTEDMLMIKTALKTRELQNIDREDALLKLANRFTIGQLTCIIELLTSANNDLFIRPDLQNLVGGGIMDRLFIEITEAIK